MVSFWTCIHLDTSMIICNWNILGVRGKMNWGEMSSCGQGDSMSPSRFPHCSTWQTEAGGQGCPLGHSGQSRSAGTSSRAREANSNPWDGEILHFPTSQSSGDRGFLLLQVFSSRSWSAPWQGWRSGGYIRQSFPAHLRSSPCSALTGKNLEILSCLGTPMQEGEWKSRGGSQAAELSWMKCPSKVWTSKRSFPWVKCAMGGVSPSSGVTWLLSLSDIFQSLHWGFPSSAAKFPGSFPQLNWLSCQLDNN